MRGKLIPLCLVLAANVACASDPYSYTASQQSRMGWVSPTERLQQTLTYHHVKKNKTKEPKFNDLRAFKHYLKSMAALKVTDSIQVGVDRIHVEGLDLSDCAVLKDFPQWDKSAPDKISVHGYGIEFKWKF